MEGKLKRANSKASGQSSPGAYPNRTTGSRFPKSEILNPKSETNPKQQTQMVKTAPSGGFRTLKHWVFEFVSDFGFRISDLCRLSQAAPPRCARAPPAVVFAKGEGADPFHKRTNMRRTRNRSTTMPTKTAASAPAQSCAARQKAWSTTFTLIWSRSCVRDLRSSTMVSRRS